MGMSIKLEDARNNIMRLLQDPYGSGSIDAVKNLFQALVQCGVGYTEGREDGKSSNFGCLDLGNHESLMVVLSDRATLREMVRMFYYNFEETPEWPMTPEENHKDNWVRKADKAMEIAEFILNNPKCIEEFDEDEQELIHLYVRTIPSSDLVTKGKLGEALRIVLRGRVDIRRGSEEE
jgi:hypothetical protein